MKIAISACLLGDNVRYDGSDKRNDELIKLLDKHEIIKICPELESGFKIPHEPLEIRNNKVYTKSNKDVTKKLNKGSKLCLEKVLDCDLLILKSKSPSCGYKKIYDGSFNNKLVNGNGIFTDLCLKNNLKVYSENDLEIIREILL